MAAVSCRGILVLRCYDVSRVLTVTSSIATTRKYRNETWCRRWWHISQRSLSTTVNTFGPTLTSILTKEAGDTKETGRESKNAKTSRRVTETRSAGDGAETADVTVTYHRGLSKITVPLPSRKEHCVFSLKPITHTVGDFIQMLKTEDRGIDRAVITRIDGIRVGASNTIETLMEEDFKLVINDNEYTVALPVQEKHTMEEMQKLSDVQTLVGQLYETLHVREYKADMEKQVLVQLEQVRIELEPLELKLQELQDIAVRWAKLRIWGFLVLMSMQFGALARLTWWEYSWDIMEPVTYFVTYGTSIAWLIYFLLTKQEYILSDVLNRQYLKSLHSRIKKTGFDVDLYNRLKDEAYELETTLKIIRGPLHERRRYVERKWDRSSSSSSRSPSSSPSPSPDRTLPRKKESFDPDHKIKPFQSDKKFS